MSNPYNVKVAGINFYKKVVEPNAKALFDNVITGGPDGQVRELTDYSRTRKIYLILHISFEYDDILGDRVAGTSIYKDESLLLATVHYDSNDLITSVENSEVPDRDTIMNIAQTQAENRVESYYKELLLNNNIDALVRSLNKENFVTE